MQSQRLDYIPNDGYTEDGYIKPLERVYSETRFKYRPALVQEQMGIEKAQKDLPSDKYIPLAAKFVVRKLVSWSVKDHAGNALSISVDNVQRLKPDLFWAIFNIVLGLGRSDADPQWEAEQAAAKAEQELEAIAEGVPVAAVREETDAKNSPTA